MRTVTPIPTKDETTHMGVVGVVLALGTALLLLPLVPLLLALRLLAAIRSDRSPSER